MNAKIIILSLAAACAVSSFAEGRPYRTRLDPSDKSPLVFKTEFKKDAVLRATIKLDDRKDNVLEGKGFVYGKDYWGVSIQSKNADWSWAIDFKSVIMKSGKTKNRRDVVKTLEDGQRHKCLIKLRPLKEENGEPLISREWVEILEVEFLPEDAKP